MTNIYFTGESITQTVRNIRKSQVEGRSGTERCVTYSYSIKGD